MRTVRKIIQASLTLATMAVALAAAFVQPADAQGLQAGAGRPSAGTACRTSAYAPVSRTPAFD